MRSAAVSICFAIFLAVFIAPPARAGVGWPAEGLEVASGATAQREPLVVADGSGGSIIIWADTSTGAETLYAQRFTRQGQRLWPGGGVPLTTTLPPSYQRYPTAVPDGYGGCLVFWQDNRGTYTQIYGQHLTYIGTRGWGEDAMVPEPNTAHQTQPAAVSDGVGGAVVVWRDWRNAGESGDVDLYATRVGTSGAALYTEHPAIVSSAVTVEGAPVLAGYGVGGVLVGWATAQTDQTGRDIYAQYLNSNGVRQWSDTGVTVCQAAGQQDFLAVAGDGAGGMWLAWEDHRAAPTGVYLQHLNDSGTAQLSANGDLISGSALAALTPAMAFDGRGGAFVAYPVPSPSPGGLYYRHAMPGVSMLADGDLPIYAGAGMYFDAAVLMGADGLGGCFVAWRDERSGTFLMYGQHLTGSDAPSFPEGGIPLAEMDQFQISPSLAVTGRGRAVCAWSDGRNIGIGNDLDVYGQSLIAGGAPSALPLLLNP